MWLTVVWLLATMPVATLHHAVDLGALFGKRAHETSTIVDASIGQWAFFATVGLMIGSGGELLNGMPTMIAFALATIVLAVLLTFSKRARFNSRAQAAYQTQPA